MGGNRPRSIEMPKELSPLNPVQPDLPGQNESFIQTRNTREENLAGGMRSMPRGGRTDGIQPMPEDGMNGSGGMMPGEGMNGSGGIMPGDRMDDREGMMPGDGMNGSGGMMPRDGIDNMHMQPMPADVTAGRGMRSRPEQSELGENVYGEPDRNGMRTMPDGSITRPDSSMHNAMPEEDMYTMPDGSMRTTPDGDMRTRPDSRMYTTPDGSMRMMPEGPNAHTDLRMVPEQDLRAMPYSDSMGTGRHINPENNGMQCSRCMPAEAWQHAGRMRMPASENQAGGSYMPYADQMYTSSDQMVQNGMQGTADHMMQGEMQGLSEQRMQDGMQQGTSDRMMQDGMGQGTSDRMMQDRMNGYAQDYPDETADTAVDYNSMNLMRQEPGDLSEGNMMADQPMGELRPMGFGSVKAYAEAGRTARKNALPWENTGVSSQMMQDYLAQI